MRMMKDDVVMSVGNFPRVPIAPDTQELLQDEEGNEAGEQQPGKLTSGPDSLD
jgi:hypothetical protein